MFRMINVAGRSALEADGAYHDLATLSGDPSLADPMVAVARFDDLHALAGKAAGRRPEGEVAKAKLEAPVPTPRQVFAIGLNYSDHAVESGMALPPAPLTFTKFPSSISGPHDEVPLTGEMVDWEVELVAVVGRACRNVAREEAWDALAGLTLGQDISDRAVQLTGAPPQFSLGKSFTGFSPIGPALVSVDAFASREDIAISCAVNGEEVQSSSSRHMIFDVATLVAYLSSICELYPGDVIFTGTPDGVGMGRGRFLKPGDVLTSEAEVIGSLRNSCVAGTGAMAL